MSVDCQWVEKNLEALFCDRLSDQESRSVRAHMDSCLSCRKEAQALNAIDPLIKSHFRRQLEIARRPRVIHKGRVFGFGSAAAAVAVVLTLLVVRAPHTSPVVPSVAVLPDTTPVASAETPAPIKNDATEEPKRAKPSTEPGAPADRLPAFPAVSSNAPDFLVTDPAGYSHTLDEYRGRVVVIGVWGHDQAESVANLERLYKAHAANSRLRFLGVTNERQTTVVNLTFPVVYNQGSKLFGAQPGDFVLLDENGAVALRGSLVKDFESLTKALRQK
jgi:hypothetical protein